MSLSYLLNSGKNPKWKYYAVNGIRGAVPACFYRQRLKKLLDKAVNRDDYNTHIKPRVDYYNQLTENAPLGSAPPLSDLKPTKEGSVYFLDSREHTTYFNPQLCCNFLFGDVVHVPEFASIVKSRPLGCDNKNSVVLKLDKIRHFLFVNDKIPFHAKQNKAIFMGKIGGKENRFRFMELFFGHPLCDAADVSRKSSDIPPEWQAPKKTIADHLKYKFILALEGADVASNLKWIMSSNSVAVMPRPTCETWFMEGTLIPNHHYIEIAADFSDVEERLNYYIEHPGEAEQIIANANQYVEQFKDKRREKLISLLVLEKYFKQTCQL